MTVKVTSLEPWQILRIRRGLHMSQREFGDLLGVDEKTVSDWERGVHVPKEDSGARLLGIAKRDGVIR